MLSKFEALLGVAVVGVLIGEQMANIAVGIAATVACGLGIYASGRWATRQVPDVETRKRLANPE
jgi:hypothetical protein